MASILNEMGRIRAVFAGVQLKECRTLTVEGGEDRRCRPVVALLGVSLVKLMTHRRPRRPSRCELLRPCLKKSIVCLVVCFLEPVLAPAETFLKSRTNRSGFMCSSSGFQRANASVCRPRFLDRARAAAAAVYLRFTRLGHAGALSDECSDPSPPSLATKFALATKRE